MDAGGEKFSSLCADWVSSEGTHLEAGVHGKLLNCCEEVQ